MKQFLMIAALMCAGLVMAQPGPKSGNRPCAETKCEAAKPRPKAACPCMKPQKAEPECACTKPKKEPPKCPCVAPKKPAPRCENCEPKKSGPKKPEMKKGRADMEDAPVMKQKPKNGEKNRRKKEKPNRADR